MKIKRHNEIDQRAKKKPTKSKCAGSSKVKFNVFSIHYESDIPIVKSTAPWESIAVRIEYEMREKENKGRLHRETFLLEYVYKHLAQ